MVGVYLEERVAGLLMDKELTYFANALEAPQRPFLRARPDRQCRTPTANQKPRSGPSCEPVASRVVLLRPS